MIADYNVTSLHHTYDGTALQTSSQSR